MVVLRTETLLLQRVPTKWSTLVWTTVACTLLLLLWWRGLVGVGGRVGWVGSGIDIRWTVLLIVNISLRLPQGPSRQLTVCIETVRCVQLNPLKLARNRTV